MLIRGDDSIVTPFEGFRERIEADERAKVENELHDKEKKSLPKTEGLSDNNGNINEQEDEERLGAHYRKPKTKIPPFTTEYITGNRYSPLDDEVSNALAEKYKQSFESKQFPFEYVNVDNEIPEQRIYFEDKYDDFSLEPGSGELDLKGYCF